jgi:hypothetical protein
MGPIPAAAMGPVIGRGGPVPAPHPIGQICRSSLAALTWRLKGVWPRASSRS